jgi:hypothetical protein
MATKYVIYTGLPQTMTEDQILAMKTELEGIRDGFEPDPIFDPVVSTQYITSTYNQAHPTATIDGATVEMVLQYEAPASEAPLSAEKTPLEGM